MLHGHLKGGKYDNADENLKQENKSVNNANSIGERDFGMLDRLMREKPSCNMKTFEGNIMSRNNKTSEWRNNLNTEKRAIMMKWARESTAKQYDDFEMIRSEIRKLKNENRFKKN